MMIHGTKSSQSDFTRCSMHFFTLIPGTGYLPTHDLSIDALSKRCIIIVSCELTKKSLTTEQTRCAARWIKLSSLIGEPRS